MSLHPPHLKNSPSAFIPFCEYNGDMLAVGEKIDNFPLPVCNAFKPTVIEGQLCYTFQSNSTMATNNSDKQFLMFLLDYNEDRQYSELLGGEDDNEDKLQTLDEMEDSVDRTNEAMIYIHTLGKYVLTRFLIKQEYEK